MMLASSATMFEMTEATSFTCVHARAVGVDEVHAQMGRGDACTVTSCSDMSEVPVMVKTTALAFSIGKSSSGDDTYIWKGADACT